MGGREVTLTRRGFLRTSGVAAGSLVLGCSSASLPRAAWQSRSADEDGAAFDAWIAITPDDRILVHAPKAEMGQGTYTAFATLVGEELRTPPNRIEILAAPVDQAFGGAMQMTGGSTSLREIWLPLRESGARAREMLKSAAAERWQVEASTLEVDDGAVTSSATGQRLRFGDLARAAASRPVPATVELTPPQQWRYVGKSLPRVDGAAKSTGRARYGMDVQLPGMLTAVVVHCPHVRGSLLSYDDSAVRGLEGVVAVFALPAGGVAIVAENYWRARSAAAALEVRWDAGESKGVDNASIRAGLVAALEGDDLHSAREDGNAADELDSADRVHEAEYELPCLAHATMEPINCTVAPRKGGCDVYIGTQAPASVQDAVAFELDLPRSAVLVHNQLLGGGFGRRFFADMAFEAAQIARLSGKTIKLVWSREDDMARDYYRPPSLHRLRAKLGADGQPEAWEHKFAVPSLIPEMASSMAAFTPQWMRGIAMSLTESMASRLPGWIGPIVAIEGANDQPYRVPNVSVEAVAWDAGIPVGIWRSVGHSHNGFVVESFIDELAHAAGADAAAYRRDLLVDHPRHLAVLDRLLEEAAWDTPTDGRSQGLAVHASFNSVVGQVAEVSVTDGELKVHRVTCVIDCGLVVNPDIVKAQMESAIQFGLTATLYGEIHFKDGAAIESNFHDHRMLRMAEAPEIEVHILASDAPPAGVGEPGTPPIAPAVANAIFAATGKRLRTLPLRLA